MAPSPQKRCHTTPLPTSFRRRMKRPPVGLKKNVNDNTRKALALWFARARPANAGMAVGSMSPWRVPEEQRQCTAPAFSQTPPLSAFRRRRRYMSLRCCTTVRYERGQVSPVAAMKAPTPPTSVCRCLYATARRHAAIVTATPLLRQAFVTRPPHEKNNAPRRLRRNHAPPPVRCMPLGRLSAQRMRWQL